MDKIYKGHKYFRIFSFIEPIWFNDFYEKTRVPIRLRSILARAAFWLFIKNVTKITQAIDIRDLRY